MITLVAVLYMFITDIQITFNRDHQAIHHPVDLRFLEQVVPNLPNDQVFYEDKTEKGSLKQVNRN